MTETRAIPDVSVAHTLESKRRRRRWPLGSSRPKMPIEWPADYVEVTDRGALIALHPIDPEIYGGGRVETEIRVGRLACLAGLIHGRLVYRVAACLWNPPAREHEDVA